MDNRLNMLFNQELDNEAQYIKSHPFSSINMSLGGEVRYIAPIWPWNAPRFQALDWRLQPPLSSRALPFQGAVLRLSSSPSSPGKIVVLFR